MTLYIQREFTFFAKMETLVEVAYIIITLSISRSNFSRSEVIGKLFLSAWKRLSNSIILVTVLTITLKYLLTSDIKPE